MHSPVAAIYMISESENEADARKCRFESYIRNGEDQSLSILRDHGEFMFYDTRKRNNARSFHLFFHDSEMAKHIDLNPPLSNMLSMGMYDGYSVLYAKKTRFLFIECWEPVIVADRFFAELIVMEEVERLKNQDIEWAFRNRVNGDRMIQKFDGSDRKKLMNDFLRRREGGRSSIQ